MDIKEKLLEITKPYGIKGINFGGCIELQAKGFKGAMRRKAHAHWVKKTYKDFHGTDYKWYGWICFKTIHPEKRAFNIKNAKPTKLFWHEVGHIYRSSWTEEQCDDFAKKQIRKEWK